MRLKPTQTGGVKVIHGTTFGSDKSAPVIMVTKLGDFS